ncbi:MAG: sensor histidine kinase [Wenzhouxiangella sp.]
MWKSKSTSETQPDVAALAHKVDRLSADNHRLVEEFDNIQRHFSSLARSVWRVQEDERRKLARELHDGVGQSLTALRFQLERLPESTDRENAIELVGQILDDVRELSRLLRPPVLDDLGLAAALKWLARRMRESSGLPIVAEVDALDEMTLDDDAETLLFRVVQESLHNTVRHAGASRARLQASRAGNRIEIRISDDGSGFDVARLDDHPERAGVGLAGMRDRVRIFGGDLAIRSAPDRGTTITVGLPVDTITDSGEAGS